jgi:hypothetical protein
VLSDHCSTTYKSKKKSKVNFTQGYSLWQLSLDKLLDQIFSQQNIMMRQAELQ